MPPRYLSIADAVRKIQQSVNQAARVGAAGQQDLPTGRFPGQNRQGFFGLGTETFASARIVRASCDGAPATSRQKSPSHACSILSWEGTSSPRVAIDRFSSSIAQRTTGSLTKESSGRTGDDVNSPALGGACHASSSKPAGHSRRFQKLAPADSRLSDGCIQFFLSP